MTSRILITPHLGIVIASSLATTLALFTIFKCSTPCQDIIKSPREAQLRNFSSEEKDGLPYPPDLLPGGRDVTSPYGTTRVYEWGPEDGRKVLFVHGISTPCIALSEMAHGLVAKGCRVLLFDLFGRGYSDDVNLPHDSRLYITQILLAIASSPLPWTPEGFSLIGYSFGGGIAADFTVAFPDMVKSLVLLAPVGLIRSEHFGWQSRLMYSGILPTRLVEWIVRGRLGGYPAEKPVMETGSEGESLLADDLKRNRDPKFENAVVVVVKDRPNVTVADVVGWQLEEHKGFVRSFVSSMMWGSIEGPRPAWKALGERKEKILVIVGEEDPIMLVDELRIDVEDVIGAERVQFRVIEGDGHDFPISAPERVVAEVSEAWGINM
ncbi:related to alpha/beta hydrolase family protein [Rhynchosporium secalis]|uniref:Related to alpha/beta hydrolase family protein n=1 Tax=Rhynchosporium secalis TaxID=38038 RepID=A0A1E1MFR3_RHYSE|nr:related to alpha/beta hydrolase family protein [Rhynchosporium secalis]